MSTLLGGWPHHACHGLGHFASIVILQPQVGSGPVSSTVILEPPISVGSRLPFGIDPSTFLETMQCRIESTVLHLQEVIRGPLNVLVERMTVSMSIEKRP
jgi:hypothetical protein